MQQRILTQLRSSNHGFLNSKELISLDDPHAFDIAEADDRRRVRALAESLYQALPLVAQQQEQEEGLVVQKLHLFVPYLYEKDVDLIVHFLSLSQELQEIELQGLVYHYSPAAGDADTMTNLLQALLSNNKNLVKITFLNMGYGGAPQDQDKMLQALATMDKIQHVALVGCARDFFAKGSDVLGSRLLRS